jgi:ABC-type nitrate/sulfonate/bicarbonate transport system permease component
MVGELYAATAGIGFMITVAGATFQTDKVFVGVLIFAITGMMPRKSLTEPRENSTSGVRGLVLTINVSLRM